MNSTPSCKSAPRRSSPPLTSKPEATAFMRSQTLLLFLLAIGSACCWWPLMVEPNLDFASWIPLLCIALCTTSATLLGERRLRLLTFATVLGTLAGLCIGFAMWPPRDPIAGSWVPYIAIAMTIGTAFVSLIFGGVARLVSLPEKQKFIVWIAFFSVVAFGPVAVAVTPPLVRHRIRNNERIAAERFAGLSGAVKRTAGEHGDSNRICDGSVLRQHYAGPGFSDEDWRRITGNYVKQSGYVFMVYCREKGGYTIVAEPARMAVDGSRRLCTDESGRLACGMEWNRSRKV